MHIKTVFFALAPVGVLSLLFAPACGQAVATCASICALPGAPTANCEEACSAAESKCTTTACSADFQLLLTCVENTQEYTSIAGLCAAPAKTVDVSVTSFGDGGVLTDAQVPTCATATCASVCAGSGSTSEVDSCTAGCETTQAECPLAAEAYQSLLTCLCGAGGVNMAVGTSATAECATIAVELDQSCPGLFQEVDAG